MRYRFGAFLLCALPLTIGSQEPAHTSVRDQNGGTIAGRVVTDNEMRRPLARAIVRLRGAAIGERTAITTDDGRFAFGTLPTGRFTVVATKAAYVDTAYGATRSDGIPTAIVVEAHTRADLTISLPYGAIVAGTIGTRSNEPVPGIHVLALRVERDGSVRELARVETDDRGEYRIFGLAAGDYLLSATMPALTRVPEAIPQPSVTEMDAMLRMLRRSTERPAPPPATTVTYAPVYFPGVWLPQQATRVTLAHGEERGGLDFDFDPVRTVVISGSVAGPLDDLRSVQISLQPAGPVRSTSVRTAAATSDGTFTFSGIPPGRYRVLARATREHAIAASRSTIKTQRKAAADERSHDATGQLYAATDVEANGADVNGVALILQPAATLSGRVRFASTRLVAPKRLPGIHVTLVPVGVSAMPIASGFSMIREANVRADGTFVLSGIAPGRYRLQAALPTDATDSGWRIHSMILEGRDVLSSDFEVAPGADISNVVVTFSDAGGTKTRER